ncbi:Leucine-responsive regulatory protein [compost metagenome]|jgi:Lrp/AsnC family leucine-responsive transcriptional regulator|uniref:Lrp/AsnC family transcriptional regulator n=1 Tax=Pseudomonas neuropathica TaxID=2730425 RepID=A0ACC7MU55_9PSED|nr:Lrp/AsnC family transcriptional regulator [Pseudomonas sp. YuFO8]MEB2621947.1 Lrp/AsnC family transcriptional regulator [Pseudomonas sp. YuFO8]
MKKLIKKEAVLDPLDKSIITALNSNARLSVKALSRQVGLSAPSCGERLRHLERTAIKGYCVDVDPEVVGYRLQMIVRMRSNPGQMQTVEQLLREAEECVTFYKVTGDDDFVCVMYLRSVDHLDELLCRFAPMAATHTSLIKAMERKLPPL